MSIPPKKLNNSSPGTANTAGGDDWDAISDYLNDVDKTGPARINTETRIRSGKFKFRDTGNDHNYIHNFSNLAADRTVTWPLLTADDEPLFKAFAATVTNKTVDNALNALKMHGAYKYTIFIDANDSNKIKCLDNNSGTIVSNHATDADVPIQYAIDNAAGAGIFIQRGNYNLATGLVLTNKYVTMHGEKTVEDFQTTGQTVLIKDYTSDASNVFINAVGDPYYYVDLRHLVIQGDLEGTGLEYNHNIRWLEDVHIMEFRNGLVMTDIVYVNFFKVIIEDCVDYGMKLFTCNTLMLYGCRINGCDTNLYIEDGRFMYFYGTNLEGSITYGAYLKSNSSAAEPNNVRFDGCTFETFSSTTTANVYDEGRGNVYYNCKFESSDTDLTAIHLSANARYSQIKSCYFMMHNSSSAMRIIIDSGAQRIKFLWNMIHSGGQITSFVFDDSGTDTKCIGNDPLTTGNVSIPDKIPYSSALVCRPDMAKIGCYYGSGTTAADGILNSRLSQVAVGTGTSSAGTDSTGSYRTYDTAATINSLAGHQASATYMERGNHAYFKTALYLNHNTNVRIFAGLVASSSAPASAADPLNALSGVGLWLDDGVSADWKLMHNDSSGASVKDAIGGGVAAATATLYTFEVYATGSKFVAVLNGTSTDLTTDIPAASTNLGFWVYIENTTGASRTMRNYYIVTKTDK